MDSTSDKTTVTELLDIWQEALDSIVALSESLTPDEWGAQTPCPGWTVADVVAHVTDIEQLFGGEERPEHAPDWDALTHVQNDFGRLTEVGVDFRRGRDPQILIAELKATIVRRRAQMEALPEGAQVLGPNGMTSLDRFLRTRTFDTWVHEQDIRWAIGRDGGWASNAAGIAFTQMVKALPYVWGHNVKAPIGSTLVLTIIGPDLHHESAVTVGEDGRGSVAASAENPDVTADMTWAAFMRLSCGRVQLDDPWLADKVEISGDKELSDRLLPAMSFTP